jgi:hypothetical protein
VIREDRELLAELAQLNTDLVPLAMHMMEGSATAQEQRVFAQRLIAAGERLHHRADESERVVIDGKVIAGDNGALCVDAGISADTTRSRVWETRYRMLRQQFGQLAAELHGAQPPTNTPCGCSPLLSLCWGSAGLTNGTGVSSAVGHHGHGDSGASRHAVWCVALWNSP